MRRQETPDLSVSSVRSRPQTAQPITHVRMPPKPKFTETSERVRESRVPLRRQASPLGRSISMQSFKSTSRPQTASPAFARASAVSPARSSTAITSKHPTTAEEPYLMATLSKALKAAEIRKRSRWLASDSTSSSHIESSPSVSPEKESLPQEASPIVQEEPDVSVTMLETVDLPPLEGNLNIVMSKPKRLQRNGTIQDILSAVQKPEEDFPTTVDMTKEYDVCDAAARQLLTMLPETEEDLGVALGYALDSIQLLVRRIVKQYGELQYSQSRLAEQLAEEMRKNAIKPSKGTYQLHIK